MLAYLVVLGAWLVLCFRGVWAQGAPPARPDRMTAAMRRAMDINIETHG